LGLFNKIKNRAELQENSKEIAEKLKYNFRQNRWSVFALVAFSAISTVIYVRNVQNINHLAETVDDRQKILNELKNENEVLNHKLIELQSPERINEISTTKLGMIKPDKAPIIIEEND
jgi:cell division protein FtsB